MKVELNQMLNTPTEEILEIKIIFNPKNDEEEGLAAVVATITDLVKNYNRLNTLVDDTPAPEGDDNGQE